MNLQFKIWVSVLTAHTRAPYPLDWLHELLASEMGQKLVKLFAEREIIQNNTPIESNQTTKHAKAVHTRGSYDMAIIKSNIYL